MKSFVVKLHEFFSLNRTQPNIDNFEATKRQLLIPLYQREYKWENEKIESLIFDINIRDKFLGIIILDENQFCYEIVDARKRT